MLHSSAHRDLYESYNIDNHHAINLHETHLRRPIPPNQLDQLQEALLLQNRLIQQEEYEERQFNAESHQMQHQQQQTLSGEGIYRLSPASSVSSFGGGGGTETMPFLNANNGLAGTNGVKLLKKRSISKSSGFKSLGRIFGGARKTKSVSNDLRQNMLLDGGRMTGGYSDSEVSSIGDGDFGISSNYSTNNLFPVEKSINNEASSSGNAMSSSSIGGCITADYDKRKKKKHELLEEVIDFFTAKIDTLREFIFRTKDTLF